MPNEHSFQQTKPLSGEQLANLVGSFPPLGPEGVNYYATPVLVLSDSRAA